MNETLKNFISIVDCFWGLGVARGAHGRDIGDGFVSLYRSSFSSLGLEFF